MEISDVLLASLIRGQDLGEPAVELRPGGIAETAGIDITLLVIRPVAPDELGRAARRRGPVIGWASGSWWSQISDKSVWKRFPREVPW